MHAKYSAILVCIIISVSVPGTQLYASRVEELHSDISAKNEEIKRLESEIASLETSLKEVDNQKVTLSQTIKSLDLSISKLSNQIRSTQNSIAVSRLTISRLALDIELKEKHIEFVTDELSVALQELNETGDVSFVEHMLGEEELSDFWNNIENLQGIQDALRLRIKDVKNTRDQLAQDKASKVAEMDELTKLSGRLADEKTLTGEDRSKKSRLLGDTKNKESLFKKQLDEKLKKKEAVEKELLDFEAQLKIKIDPSFIPAPGRLLFPPLGELILTQAFGDTLFARTNPQAYAGKGHNGVDFRATRGTAVRAASSGIITATGDTDSTCQGASYGKWILIEHRNGLSTLYAHLSLIKVRVGDSVAVGDRIGYSGDTGYATGPHLHFSVFVTKGVSVGTLKSRVKGCGTYLLPRASFNSYLNPLAYL